MSVVVPVFYLYTSPEVLPIPESVGDPNSTKVTLVSVPSLEENINAAARQAVVTLVIGGAILQSKVINSGDTVQYSTSLYQSFDISNRGIIYVRQEVGSTLDDRRLDILQRLNTPDFEVIGIQDNVIPTQAAGDPVRRTVQLEPEAMLRVPVREIVQHFSTVFASSSTVIAPGIATFVNFTSLPLSTAFISLSDYEHFVLGTTPTTNTNALGGSLQSSDTVKQSTEMTSTGWTVFGILWGIMAVVSIISIGAAYWWYLAQYL